MLAGDDGRWRAPTTSIHFELFVGAIISFFLILFGLFG